MAMTPTRTLHHGDDPNPYPFAKDLMEVDRSTLFMLDKDVDMLYTIVADCAEPSA